jgi:cytochrome c1
MPNVLWEYQGEQALHVTERQDPNTGDMIRSSHLVLESPGASRASSTTSTPQDLVNYLAYMAEPAQADRKFWGIIALFVLSAFAVIALMLKNEFWKDVK